MSRRNVKESIKTFIETIEGVKAVYIGVPREQHRYPAVVVNLSNSDETAPTMPRGTGRKKVEYRCRLDVVNLSADKDVSASELAFDDLVDSICDKIRENYTLDGVVFSAGTKFIRTEFADPRLAGKDGGSVFRLATIEFDIVDYVVG